jgi:hypothetical protein
MSDRSAWGDYLEKRSLQKNTDRTMRARRTPGNAADSPTAATNEPIAGTVPLFSRLCVAAGLPLPIAEFRFAPPRRWRFDYAFLGEKLAVEVQGGIFTQGRHTRGPALLKEFEKLNAAAALGWRVLFVTPQQMDDGEAVPIATRAIKGGIL